MSNFDSNFNFELQRSQTATTRGDGFIASISYFGDEDYPAGSLILIIGVNNDNFGTGYNGFWKVLEASQGSPQSGCRKVIYFKCQCKSTQMVPGYIYMIIPACEGVTLSFGKHGIMGQFGLFSSPTPIDSVLPLIRLCDAVPEVRPVTPVNTNISGFGSYRRIDSDILPLERSKSS